MKIIEVIAKKETTDTKKASPPYNFELHAELEEMRMMDALKDAVKDDYVLNNYLQRLIDKLYESEEVKKYDEVVEDLQEEAKPALESIITAENEKRPLTEHELGSIAIVLQNVVGFYDLLF